MDGNRLPGRRLSTIAAAAVLGAVFFSPGLFFAPPAAAGYVEGLSNFPLRDEPQFSAEPTMRLPIGQEVDILEEDQGWVKVRVGDRTGWMPSSVVGDEAPANLRLGPLQKRMREMDTRIAGLEDENNSLREENGSLTGRVASQAEDLERVRDSGSRARNLQRLRLIALGGGFVIFGWITGYALAAAVHRPGSKKKYIID